MPFTKYSFWHLYWLIYHFPQDTEPLIRFLRIYVNTSVHILILVLVCTVDVSRLYVNVGWALVCISSVVQIVRICGFFPPRFPNLRLINLGQFSLKISTFNYSNSAGKSLCCNLGFSKNYHCFNFRLFWDQAVAAHSQKRVITMFNFLPYLGSGCGSALPV